MIRPASIPHAVRSRHLARILPCLAGCLAAVLVTVDTAEAGRFGGGFRSSGSASRAATMGSRPSVQSAASAAASRSTPAAPSSPRATTPSSSASSAASTSSASRPTATPPSPAAPRVGASGSSGSTSAKSAPRTPSKSLLDQAPPPPSQHLTQVIRERERSSGMGWFLGGMAFYSILHSDNNLSAADRSWIEDRIEEEKQQGTASPAPAASAAQPEQAPELEKAPAPAPGPGTALTFAYDVPARFVAGEAYRFTVKASDRLGAQAPVTCELEGAQIGSVAGLAASVEWTPTAPGVQVITCSSLGTVDQRLFDIEKPKANAQTRNDSRAI